MENLLKTLLKNYLDEVPGVLGVSTCDRNGLILASEGREDTGEESVIGAISAVVDTSIDRIKSEFGTESNFFSITTIGNRKFAFCSQGLNAILTSIADPSTSDIEIRVFSEHVAGKIELLLEGNEKVSLEIPAIIKAIAKTKDGVLPKGEFSTKLIITGAFQVGKTSLIDRFVHNRFQENYISTIGVQITKKIVNLSPEIEINFIIWDIGGQITQMAPHRAKFYHGANAAFIVLDRTRPETLDKVKLWYDDIKQSVQKKIPIVIVGNKSDVEEILVSEDDIKKVAEEYGFHYILTSAKTGENVNDTFLYIAHKFLQTL